MPSRESSKSFHSANSVRESISPSKSPTAAPAGPSRIANIVVRREQLPQQPPNRDAPAQGFVNVHLGATGRRINGYWQQIPKPYTDPAAFSSLGCGTDYQTRGDGISSEYTLATQVFVDPNSNAASSIQPSPTPGSAVPTSMRQSPAYDGGRDAVPSGNNTSRGGAPLNKANRYAAIAPSGNTPQRPYASDPSTQSNKRDKA